MANFNAASDRVRRPAPSLRFTDSLAVGGH